MKQNGVAKEIMSSSPLSVMCFRDTSTITDIGDAISPYNTLAGTKLDALDEYYDVQTEYQYNPSTSRYRSEEDHYLVSSPSNIDRFQSSSGSMNLETATQNGSNECYIHNSIHAGHVEPVPDMLRNYTSATSLDYTLDGDQWIDTRKVAATISLRSSRRSRRCSKKSSVEERKHTTILNNVNETHRPADSHFNASASMADRGLTPTFGSICSKNIGGSTTTQYESHIGRVADGTHNRERITTTIQVSPGEFMRLRGADETWRAIMDDFYMPCTCVCCNLTLFCIQDANFVLCPECRVVSPMDDMVYDEYDGGVGLGFTIEDLGKWQEEIAFKQKIDHRNRFV
jgi:hypothetical protein